MTLYRTGYCLTDMGGVPCTSPTQCRWANTSFVNIGAVEAIFKLQGAQQILPYFGHFRPIWTVTAVLYLGA